MNRHRTPIIIAAVPMALWLTGCATSSLHTAQRTPATDPGAAKVVVPAVATGPVNPILRRGADRIAQNACQTRGATATFEGAVGRRFSPNLVYRCREG